jgi:hypothetical protein
MLLDGNTWVRNGGNRPADESMIGVWNSGGQGNTLIEGEDSAIGAEQQADGTFIDDSMIDNTGLLPEAP